VPHHLARLGDAIDDLAARLTGALDGRIDVLVNNAGVPKRRGVDELTPEDVESIMRINYFSPVRLTLAMLPGMLERDAGDIMNVSSMGVHMAAYRVSAYSAAKAALEYFTEGLYLELGGTGVRAHLFVPGTTATEFSTPKPGNNPPFPSDPASTSTAEQVALAMLDALETDAFVTYTSEREAGTSAKRNEDVNGWLANLRGVFTGR
jgi:short-subunit dehydrogenase